MRCVTIAVVFLAGVAGAASRVPIEIRNPAGKGFERCPITTGVPFPPGTLVSPERVRLLDESGAPVPLQSVCTGRHADGSVRWLLLDWQADVPVAGRRLALEFGNDVSPTPVPAPLVVRQSETAIEVDTGPLRFTVSRTAFNGLDALWLGGQAILTAGHRGGPYFVDDQGARFSAVLDTAPEVAIESQGPLRTVITARGAYVNPAGAAKCRFIVRLHAVAGSAAVRVFYTWVMTEDSRALRFRDIGFLLPLPAAQGRFALEDGRALAGPRGADTYLVQTDWDRFRTHPMTTATPTAQPLGVLTADCGLARCVLAVRDFRQLFPKELGADSAGLSFHVWPAHGVANPERKVEDAMLQYLWFCHEGEVLDFQVPESYVTHTEGYSENEYRYLRSARNANAMGLAKTHELLVEFGLTPGSVPGAPAPADAPSPAVQAFLEPPCAMAAPAWMCDAGVFGMLQPASPDRFPAYEKLLSGNFDAEARMQAATRDYGLWNYGDGHTSWDTGRQRWMDVYRVWRNSHHGSCRVPWLLYVRSGDPKYLRAAVRNARHVLDVDFCHWSTPAFEALPYPQGKLRGALNDYKGIVHWHSGNRLMDYNAMTDFALWYYHLTGDRWGLEVASEWGEAVKAKFTSPFGSRSGTGTMSALIDLYQDTHDEALRPIIEAFFEHLTTKVQNVDGKATYSDHVASYWAHLKGKPIPAGAFPEWENYAPWLERYWELTHSPAAKRALIAWADAYMAGYGDMVSLWNVGDYVSILGYAYAVSGDAKYLGRGVWEADRAVAATYAGDDARLHGLLMTGQVSLAGYMTQRLPTFMKALALYDKPVQPDPLFRTQEGFPLLFARTRRQEDGQAVKYEMVEAWVLDTRDDAFTVTLRTSHTYPQRPYRVTVTAPGGKEVVRLSESVPKGGKEFVLAVPADGEKGLYRTTVSATGSYGSVASPVVVSPPLPVAFPLAGRLVPAAGAEYFVFVPAGTTRLQLEVTVPNGGSLAALWTSPDGQTRSYGTAHSQGQAVAGPAITPTTAQTDRCWRLQLSGATAGLRLLADGASAPAVLLPEAYPPEVCRALAAAVGSAPAQP